MMINSYQSTYCIRGNLLAHRRRSKSGMPNIAYLTKFIAFLYRMFVVLVTYCAPQNVLYSCVVSTLGKAMGGGGASVTIGPRFEAGIQHLKQFVHNWHLSGCQCTEFSCRFRTYMITKMLLRFHQKAFQLNQARLLSIFSTHNAMIIYLLHFTK